MRYVICITLAACAGREPAPVVVPVTAPPPARVVVESPPGGESAPPRPDLPQPIASPNEIACAFKAKHWLGQPSNLRFDATGPAFAYVAAIDEASIEIPVGVPSLGATVEVSSRGVIVRGVVDGPKVLLRPARAFVIDEYAVPLAYAELRWMEAARPGKTTIGLELPRAIHAPALRSERDCADLTVNEVKFDALAAAGRSIGKADLRVKKIPLATTAGGSKVAELEPRTDDDRGVEVLAVQGAQKRVAWVHQEILVFGWVAASDLAPPAQMLGGLMGYGTGAGTGASGIPRRVVVCPEEIPLLAEAKGERRHVGRIAGKVPIDLYAPQGDVIPTRIARSGIHAASDATFLVRASDVESCPSAR